MKRRKSGIITFADNALKNANLKRGIKGTYAFKKSLEIL